MSEPINLEFLRKEAKKLLRQCRSGNATALARVQKQLPALSSNIQLADVQHALAREQGFANWSELKHEESSTKQFLAAVRDGSFQSAKQYIAKSRTLARASIHAACALGDAEAVSVHLENDPALLNSLFEGWPPIHYACGSPLHRLSGRHSAGISECVRLLLDRGADPDTFVLADAADPDSRVFPIYRAAMNGNRPLFLLLKQRGVASDPSLNALRKAKMVPDNNEGSINAAYPDLFNDPNFREELKQRLAKARSKFQPEPAASRHEPLSSFDPREFHSHVPSPVMTATTTEWWRLMLERGVDPNWRSEPEHATPLHNFAGWPGGCEEAMELLISFGADVHLKRRDGRTAYSVAVRGGNKAAAEVLLRHGADPNSVPPMDRLIGACRLGDKETAKAVLSQNRNLLDTVSAEDQEVLVLAATKNQIDTVRLMAEIGFDPGQLGESGMTLLHVASWHGNVEMVRLLLELRVPVNVRDLIFGAPPLAWAANGSLSCRDADDDYCAIIEGLLAAGAACESSASRSCSPRVATLLKDRNYGRID